MSLFFGLALPALLVFLGVFWAYPARRRWREERAEDAYDASFPKETDLT